MQRLDLTTSELYAFHRALRRSHTRRVRVLVLNLKGEVLADLSHRIVDGEVIVDQDAEVTRSLTLTISDPRHTLNFDTDSPDDGALFADRMIRVGYGVRVDELARYVTIPVFTGPVVKLDRAGDVVEVEAQGKELLARGPIWRPITLKKGVRKTWAIRTLMGERAGETVFSIPQLNGRLPKTISMGRLRTAWGTSRSIADTMDRQLYYNGAGRCILRTVPGKPVYTFRTGTGGDVTGGLAISNQMEDVKNAVVVEGGTPKGAKHPVQGIAVAEASHPLSPRRLGRNGVPRYLVEKVSADAIRSEKEADKRARRVLEDRLRSVVDVTLDVLPVPHLDPGDLVRVETDETAVTFRLKRFTIPLGVEGSPSMSIGYHRRTTVNRRRIRQ